MMYFGETPDPDKNTAVASLLERLVSWLLVRLRWFFSRQVSVRIEGCKIDFEGKNGVYYEENVRYVYKNCAFKSAN